MAIPSMSDSSKLTEVSLVYLDEGFSPSEPADPESANVFENTQNAKKYTSEFRSKEDNQGDQHRSGQSFSSTENDKKATPCAFEVKDVKKARKRCRLVSDHKISVSIFPENEDLSSSTKESSSHPQLAPHLHLWDHPQNTEISRLYLHQLEVEYFSNIGSCSSISDVAGSKIDPDSPYIYAESIEGGNFSFCTFPDDNNHTVLEPYNKDPEFVWNSSDWDSDLCDLYISREMSCNSNKATAGSNSTFNTDYMEPFLDLDIDSTCIYTEWDQNPGNTESQKQYSPTEAIWGSFSSDSEISYYIGEQKSNYNSDSNTDSFVLEHFDNTECTDGHPCICLPGFESFLGSSDEFEDVKGVHKDSEIDSEASELDSGEQLGIVTQTDQRHFSEFFCGMFKDSMQKKNSVNEGFLFHPKQFLQVRDSEYKEGCEYSIIRHIQNGSYGDVFCIRDKQTGFTCAAKKIPMSSFVWEEVATWSRLESPRVLQLFGLVREGPNVMLFMDLKRGSLAELLRIKSRLSESLALFYHAQVLQALQHLHSRYVVHLDVKVDNVLLSDDERQCFLCDFGLSESLNQSGYSYKTYRGISMRGTESHMPPEVARGDPCSAKADVWSSCCMLLHMLSGHQPWSRSFPHPLCLKIVSEPPPLWEIPPDCDPVTCDVIKAGLVKEPSERDSASELLEKTVGALQRVSIKQAWEESLNLTLRDVSSPPINKNTGSETTPSFPGISENLSASSMQWVSSWRETAAEEDCSDSEDNVWVEDPDVNNQKKSSWMERYWGEELINELNSSSELSSIEESHVCDKKGVMIVDYEPVNTGGFVQRRMVFGHLGEYDRSLLEESGSWDGDVRSFVDDEEVHSSLESLRGLDRDDLKEREPFLQMQTLYGPKEAYPLSEESYSESEEELLVLNKSEQKHTTAADSGPQALTCTSCSEQDFTEEGSDDLSSGVFSSCSSSDGQSFNVDWSVSTDQTSSCFFEGLGVDVWVEDVSGESLKIRERPRVKIGHIAVGISDQICLRTFSLATMDGRLVSPDTEVCESGLWLQCVPAPDGIPNWDWRIKDGKLELKQYNEYSASCSTVILEQN